MKVREIIYIRIERDRKGQRERERERERDFIDDFFVVGALFGG